MGQTATNPLDEEPMPTLPVNQASQQILRGHDHNIPSVDFSPCGQFVATASIDRTCRTWRLSDGKQIQKKSLAQLWGWGVAFVGPDAWTTTSRSEYKRISKDHLRPGKSPGQNVRDSPSLIAPAPQRRVPSVRDHRMIRSRWYAGPLHNTSCDEQETDEEHDNAQGNWQYGMMEEDHADLDDRDAALFGMDDDEGEDEWEETSSSGSGDTDEADENDDREPTQTDGRGAILGNGRPPRISHQAQDIEISADTGDDGDNEEASMDTEDGGGTTTTEDGAVAARSVVAKSPRSERRLSTATITKATLSSLSQCVESSSEQELSPKTSTTCSSRMLEPESVASEPNTAMSGPSPGHLQQNKQVEEEAGFNHDPNMVIHMAHLGETPTNQPLQELVVHGQDDIGSELPSITMISTPTQPQYPSELLLCATARNIYVLGHHIPGESETTDDSENAWDSADCPEESPDIWSTPDDIEDDEAEIDGYNVDNDEDDEDNDNDDDDDDNDDEDDDEDPPFTLALGNYWTQGQASSDYESGDDFDSEHQDTESLIVHDDIDQDDDADEEQASGTSVTLASALLNQYHRLLFRMINSTTSLNNDKSIPLLQTISVARAAATRADGRGYRQLDGIDRLFVMLPVPDLSVLIAASQKGTITIFRLLRVVDDPPPPPAQSMKMNKSNEEAGAGTNETTRSLSTTTTVTLHGAKYVLFPEMYLPRADPPPLPLIGVSVVPLQRTTHPHSRSFTDTTDTTAATSTSTSTNTTTTHRSLPPSASPSASFILHLAYLDAQLFSYEIRLRNDKDDPVNLSNIFV